MLASRGALQVAMASFRRVDMRAMRRFERTRAANARTLRVFRRARELLRDSAVWPCGLSGAQSHVGSAGEGVDGERRAGGAASAGGAATAPRADRTLSDPRS